LKAIGSTLPSAPPYITPKRKELIHILWTVCKGITRARE
jgi:hypothetical protein